MQTRTLFTDLSDAPLPLQESIHHHRELLAGLGDVQLALHRALRFQPLRVGLRLGVSLPFGQVHQDPYALEREDRSHEHLQFGTGTVDPVVALDASLGSVSAFAFAQIPIYQGPTGYRAGARFSGGVVAQRSLGKLSLRLAGSALHETAERWQGVVPTDDGNQGRTDLYLTPGATLTVDSDWTFSLDLLARVYGHAENAQLDLPLVVQFGLGRLVHAEPGMRDDEPGGAAGDVLDLVQAGELAPLEPVPDKWTVFDFWAPWCEACKVLDARLRALAAQTPGLALRRVNIVDFDSPIARRELPGVSVLPHLRLQGPDKKRVLDESGEVDALLEKLGAAMHSVN